jgi:uncharacterized repeat protein (TIGR03806 family)
VIRAALLAGLCTGLLAGCSDAPGQVHGFDAQHYPQQLSAWGIVTRRGDALVLGADVLPYDLNTPLFTDYAHKLRTVWMPAASRGHYDANDVFALPVGTILSKTFFYPRDPHRDALLWNGDDSRDFNGDGLDLTQVQLIETRLLVHQPDGWHALPYIWDDAQRDARLEIAGDIATLPVVDAAGAAHTAAYVIPTRNECANCHASNHTSGKLQPIGIAARHLNKIYRHYVDGPAPQLQRWVERGYLDRIDAAMPANALWQPGAFDDLEHRARSYLDINCGHCHNPHGAADTSGLFLNATETSPRRLGVCKPPIAAGRGTGGRLASVTPGQPDASIMIFRLDSTDPGVMMPELGRNAVHAEGVELLRRWIAGLPGQCT